MIYHRCCTNCGSDVEAHNPGGTVYCDDCKEMRRQERREKRILNARRYDEYHIVRDPVPVEQGGFAVGANITANELASGLKPEYRSFNVGTIIQDKSGERFLVLNIPKSNGMRLQKI